MCAKSLSIFGLILALLVAPVESSFAAGSGSDANGNSPFGGGGLFALAAPGINQYKAVKEDSISRWSGTTKEYLLWACGGVGGATLLYKVFRRGGKKGWAVVAAAAVCMVGVAYWIQSDEAYFRTALFNHYFQVLENHPVGEILIETFERDPNIGVIADASARRTAAAARFRAMGEAFLEGLPPKVVARDHFSFLNDAEIAMVEDHLSGMLQIRQMPLDEELVKSFQASPFLQTLGME